MKIAVCEDEKIVAEELAEKIREFMKLTYFDFSIDIFLTGEDFIKSPEIYDLLFLDCRLPDANGLTIAKELRARDIDTAIIFVTAFPEYVYESFEVQPFRYMIKPIEETVLRKALIGFVKAYEKERHISIPTSRKNHIVNLQDIVYIESDGKYSNVCLKNNLSYKSMKSISDYNTEVEIDCHSFFRTHRCYLVNMKYIDEVQGNIIIFVNGEKAEISRRKVSEFHKRYTNYLKYFAK